MALTLKTVVNEQMKQKKHSVFESVGRVLNAFAQ